MENSMQIIGGFLGYFNVNLSSNHVAPIILWF
jgi:hypothetical protein